MNLFYGNIKKLFWKGFKEKIMKKKKIVLERKSFNFCHLTLIFFNDLRVLLLVVLYQCFPFNFRKKLHYETIIDYYCFMMFFMRFFLFTFSRIIRFIIHAYFFFRIKLRPFLLNIKTNFLLKNNLELSSSSAVFSFLFVSFFVKLKFIFLIKS